MELENFEKTLEKIEANRQLAYNSGYKNGVYEALNQVFYLVAHNDFTRSELMDILLSIKKKAINISIESEVYKDFLNLFNEV